MFSRHRIINLTESLKNSVDVILSNSDSCIRNRNNRLVRFDFPTNVNRTTSWSKFNGVGEKIEKNFFQPIRIALNNHWLTVHFALDIDSLLGRQLSYAVDQCC